MLDLWEKQSASKHTWRRRVSRDSRGAPTQPDIKSLQRRFWSGRKGALNMVESVKAGRHDDPLAFVFLKSRFPKKDPLRKIAQAVFLFGVIHGLLAHMRELERDRRASRRDREEERKRYVSIVRRFHVTVQQLLTASWLMISPKTRRNIAHLWTSRVAERHDEWRGVVTGVNKVAITIVAFESTPGRWKVYLSSIRQDQRNATDLVATGYGPGKTGRRVPILCLVQVKSGPEDLADIIALEQATARLGYRDITEAERRMTEGLLRTSGEIASTRKRCLGLIMVGKTQEGTPVFDVGGRAQNLVPLIQSAIRGAFLLPA